MFQSVRGFKDILPPESERMTWLENLARGVLKRRCYKEIRLPTLEMKELYQKSTGETSDIVEKEMFALTDAGERELALRPEATPGIVRAYLENNLHKMGGSAKFFTIGSMFRAERPQAGRFREFEQIDLEYLGNANPSADAEVICTLKQILDESGLKDYSIEINSLGCAKCRKTNRDKQYDFLKAHSTALCQDCKRRMEKNPLRTLDCKQDAPSFREIAPRLELCQECKMHFDSVQALLKRTGVPFEVNPLMVRGLDYYTRTVFEFKCKHLGSQDAVAAGGRYDDLIEQMGGSSTPAIGWALGVERVLVALDQGKAPEGPAEAASEGVHCVHVVSQGSPETQAGAFFVLEELRLDSGLENVVASGGAFDRSFKSQFREANQAKAEFVVVVGDDEAKKGVFLIKNMSTGEQKEVPKDQVSSYLNERLGKKS